jgi:hypothetical protein
MRKQLNYTCILKNLLKLYCIWTWDTLWGFFGGFLCGFVLFYFSPLMRQLQNNIWGTISRIGGWGRNTKIIETETSLHLNLENFIYLFLYIFSFIYLFFIFILIFIVFIFYFQSSLCLSNAFSAYSWLVHCLSLFISLKLFLFVSLFCFFLLVYSFFPFPLTSLLSIPSHPSILNITSAIITSQKITYLHTVQGN